MHYQNIAAQMHSYVNHSNGSGMGHALHPAHGGMHQFQPTHAMAYASRAAAHRMGINPVIVNDVGGFARSFMRNLLH